MSETRTNNTASRIETDTEYLKKPRQELFIEIPTAGDTCSLHRVLSSMSLSECYDCDGHQINDHLADSLGNYQQSQSSITFPRQTPRGYTPRECSPTQLRFRSGSDSSYYEGRRRTNGLSPAQSTECPAPTPSSVSSLHGSKQPTAMDIMRQHSGDVSSNNSVGSTDTTCSRHMGLPRILSGSSCGSSNGSEPDAAGNGGGSGDERVNRGTLAANSPGNRMCSPLQTYSKHPRSPMLPMLAGTLSVSAASLPLLPTAVSALRSTRHQSQPQLHGYWEGPQSMFRSHRRVKSYERDDAASARARTTKQPSVFQGWSPGAVDTSGASGTSAGALDGDFSPLELVEIDLDTDADTDADTAAEGYAEDKVGDGSFHVSGDHR
jgi:hypothetical protein